MTKLRQRMVEELQRRNYSPETIRSYILAVKQFAEYFGKPPDRLGATHVQRFQWYMLQERKLTPGTVEMRMSALRFFFKNSTPTNFFLPVRVLSLVFRDKFAEGLERLFQHQHLVFHGECLPLADTKTFPTFLDKLSAQDWVVYAKPPFGVDQTCPAVSGSLYASRSDLQSPASFSQRIRGPLPLERLQESQQKTHHDSHWRRVSPPLSSARAAERLPAHSLLRMARQSKAWPTTAALPRSPESATRNGADAPRASTRRKAAA